MSRPPVRKNSYKPRILIDEAHGSCTPFVLALLSLIVGALAGLTGASFRLLLRSADGWRTYLIARTHSRGALGLFLVIFGIGLVDAAAAWLVFYFAPQSSGSGIPHVEHELKVGWSGNPVSIVIVKFIGGILAIGGGLALGREGPTIQMGAGIGHLIGRAFRRSSNECRVLLAAGAGAGLATAFNAPIAGAVFVLEELVGSFEISVVIATLGASASAICVSRIFLGQSPDFHVPALGFLGFGVLPVSLLLGTGIGLLGVVYNRSILAALNLTFRFSKLGGAVRAMCIGAIVGLLGWFAPSLIGGGDQLTQQALDGTVLLTALACAFVFRFFLGPLSYAARTPGGIFAPMLTIGAQAGLLFSLFWSRLIPSTSAVPQQFAIVGMAAFFASVVRAPVTGIILVTELTGGFTLFLPMLGATFAAVAAASLLKNPPIYESLRDIR
jgi:chloride channel protein, CIC family